MNLCACFVKAVLPEIEEQSSMHDVLKNTFENCAQLFLFINDFFQPKHIFLA